MREVEITKLGMLSCPALPFGQTMLAILKDKGAPIGGTFWMAPLPGYTWKRWGDIVTGSVFFRWEKTPAPQEESDAR